MKRFILEHAAVDYDMDMDDVMRINDNFDDNVFYEKLEEFISERKSNSEVNK